MIDTDHPELVEFEGETLGDTLTNLLTEVQHLREVLQSIRIDALLMMANGVENAWDIVVKADEVVSK